jgi:hypothetical protein
MLASRRIAMTGDLVSCTLTRRVTAVAKKTATAAPLALSRN